jgi:sigma-E factor negative regulatory protein RseA
MERISALMDGELDDGDAVVEIKRLGGDAEAAESWALYHLIGDSLRGEGGVALAPGVGFRERLAAEPTVLAPRRSTLPRRVRLYALSAAASVAGVAVVGWLAVVNQPGGLDLAPGVIARDDAAFIQPAAMALDESAVREYLLAHQHHSPSSSVQGVATYIRTVGLREGGAGR